MFMSREVLAASMVMLKLIPTAPNSISWRRPNFSIVNTAIQEAAKYSRHRVSYGSGSRAMASDETYPFHWQRLEFAM